MYAVGRPNLTERGRWMAAVLWGIVDLVEIQIHVSVPASVVRTRPGVVVHRRAWLPGTDGVTYHGIPVTSPVETLIDLAADLDDSTVEAAVKEADTLDLIDPGPRSPP